MKNNKNSTILKVLAAISFIAMIAINALANILPIAGIGTGEVSDSYPDLFAPAAITFAIWGLIYILLAMYTLYQFGVFNKNKDPEKSKLFNKINIFFILSSIFNSAWIFAWHYKIIWLSLILMVCIFTSLSIIMVKASKYTFTPTEKVFVRLPFSVYYGWITVASIANIVAFLVSIGWNGFGLSEAFWAVAILAVGSLIGALTICRFKDFFYGLVLIWAYSGILLKHLSADGFAAKYTGIIITVILALVLFAFAEGMVLYKQHRKED